MLGFGGLGIRADRAQGISWPFSEVLAFLFFRLVCQVSIEGRLGSYELHS